jgi:predicted DNA binding CopG/RHH family protein
MEINNIGKLCRHLEELAKVNWDNNQRPQDMKDFEEYKTFLLQSYLLVCKYGCENIQIINK